TRGRDQDAACPAAKLQDARIRRGDEGQVKWNVRAAIRQGLKIVIFGGVFADVHSGHIVPQSVEDERVESGCLGSKSAQHKYSLPVTAGMGDQGLGIGPASLLRRGTGSAYGLRNGRNSYYPDRKATRKYVTTAYLAYPFLLIKSTRRTHYAAMGPACL